MKKALLIMVKVLALSAFLAALGGCNLFSHWMLLNHSSHNLSVSLLDNSLKDGRTDFNMSPDQEEELKNDSSPSMVWFPGVPVTCDLGGKTATFHD